MDFSGSVPLLPASLLASGTCNLLQRTPESYWVSFAPAQRAKSAQSLLSHRVAQSQWLTAQGYQRWSPLLWWRQTLRSNEHSRAPLGIRQKQNWHLKLHLRSAPPSSLSCYPQPLTGFPWEYLLNISLAHEPLSQGQLLGSPTKDNCFFIFTYSFAVNNSLPRKHLRECWCVCTQVKS